MLWHNEADMRTLGELMEMHENQPVIIDTKQMWERRRRASDENILYEGNLYDIPEILQGCIVIDRKYLPDKKATKIYILTEYSKDDD